MKKQKIKSLALNKKLVSNLNSLIGGRPNHTHVPIRTRDERCIVSVVYDCPDTFIECLASEAGPSVCMACAPDPAEPTDSPG
ncbi:hypothetical protein [Kordia jejudonensis]|uniref:hypothetical protein n=1 Tax=Kordia jejudonensis TaxID=1348245 RepID=UPI00062967BF|nr:hypothetical protein [Kordia jejudonensis]